MRIYRLIPTLTCSLPWCYTFDKTEWCGILCITPRRKHDICMVLTKSHFTFHAIFRLFLLKYMSQSNIYGVYWTLGHLTGCVFWCCDTLACSYSHSIGSVISASRSMLEFYTLIKHLVLCCSLQIMLTLIALPSKLALNTPPLLKRCLSPSLWRSACWKKRLQDRWIHAELQMNYTWLTLHTESV